MRKIFNDAGISINNPACKTPSSSGCTSLGGMSQATIDMVVALKNACSSAYPSCSVTVTGGTEYFLHGQNGNISTTQHKPGGTAVDIQVNSSLNTFLSQNDTSKGTLTAGDACYSKVSWGVSPGSRDFIFCDEKPKAFGATTGRHWHTQ